MPARLVLLIAAPLLLHADDGITLGGTVINSATREPVRRALVYARRIGGDTPRSLPTSGAAQRTLGTSATTDAAGRFQFTGLEPGRYNISTERNGFVTANYGARRPGRPPVPLVLEPGHDIVDLILPIAPHGVIAGRIVDEEGEPAAGIQVLILSSGYQNGRKQLSRSTTATTNDLGEYRAYGLAGGKYYASVSGGNNQFSVMTGQQPPEEDYVPVYYPRATDPGDATPIVVNPGAVTNGIDLRLAKTRTFAVRGRITGAGIAPGTPFSLVLMPQSSAGNTRIGAVGSDGIFQVPNVVPGSYVLVASANVRSKPVNTRVPVTVGNSHIDGVQIVVRAGLAVEGRVRTEDGDAAAVARALISLQPFEVGNAAFGMLNGTKQTEGGAFRFEDVGAEHYAVWLANLPEGYYVASIRSGTEDVLAKGLDTSGPVAPLEIVVRPNSGQFTGTVSDPASHQAAAGATVVLIPEDEGRRRQRVFYSVATADQNGRFTLKHLVPGAYLLFAFEDIDFTAWFDTEYIKPFESRAAKLTVREGSNPPVEIKLIPASAQ